MMTITSDVGARLATTSSFLPLNVRQQISRKADVSTSQYLQLQQTPQLDDVQRIIEFDPFIFPVLVRRGPRIINPSGSILKEQ
jgi:hypothetical protein